MARDYHYGIPFSELERHGTNALNNDGSVTRTSLAVDQGMDLPAFDCMIDEFILDTLNPDSLSN